MSGKSSKLFRKFALNMKKVLTTLLTALLLSACAEQEKPIDHSGIIQNVRSANKVVFASMAITKTVKSERTAWYKVGKRIAVYSYDTHLRAYIDLSKLAADDLEFDDEARTVRVHMPPIEVEEAGRDMELKREYENIGLMRTELDSRERAEMKEKAAADLKRELAGDSTFRRQLTAAAEQKARAYIESLFAAEGYTADVTFPLQITQPQ